MEKIIDVSALTDQLKILLWDRSKTREELAELVIGLIEEAGEEIVRCRDCKHYQDGSLMPSMRFCYRLRDVAGKPVGYNLSEGDFCSYGERRNSK